MKKILLFAILTLLFACKNTENANATSIAEPKTGKELFENLGNCVACHHPVNKTSGPSIAEISKIYKAKKGNLVAFLKGEAEPIVDPSQYAAMQINLEFTKTLSDAELKELEKYILEK